MARVGFIHDKLDIKFLVLYIMSRVVAPIDMPTLADLTMCDEGVDYFAFAEAVHELVDTEHLVLEEDRYAITDKGRKNGAICESSLPYSIRVKCDKNVAKLNSRLRRDAQDADSHAHGQQKHSESLHESLLDTTHTKNTLTPVYSFRPCGTNIKSEAACPR